MKFKKIINENSNEWILFIHGFGGGLNSWDNQSDFFKNRYNLLLLELPGHGNSEYNSDVKLSFGNITDNIIQVLNGLSIDRVNIIGISLGSTIAYVLSILYPNRLNKIVLVGAIVNINKRLNILSKIAAIFSRLIGYRNTYRLAVYLTLPPKLNSERSKKNEEFRKEFYTNSNNLSKDEFKNWTLFILNFKKELERYSTKPLQIPCLIIMGKSDYFFLPSATAFKNSNPNVRIEIFNNSGHVVNLEAKNSFNTYVERYLLTANSQESSLSDQPHEDFELIYKYHFDALKEAADGLNKILTVFMAVLTISMIYIFENSSELDVKLIRTILSSLGVLTLLVSSISLSIIYGIYKGVKAINIIIQEKNNILYSKFQVYNFTKRGIKTIIFIGVCVIIAIGTITFIVYTDLIKL